jgi:hypothetical protein
MKFMLRWRVHDDKRHEALKSFSQMTAKEDQDDRGDKIKLIGRWHDLAGFTGVAIAESDDPQAIANWALNWNSVLDLDVTPVLDDAETREIGKKRFK